MLLDMTDQSSSPLAIMLRGIQLAAIPTGSAPHDKSERQSKSNQKPLRDRKRSKNSKTENATPQSRDDRDTGGTREEMESASSIIYRTPRQDTSSLLPATGRKSRPTSASNSAVKSDPKSPSTSPRSAAFAGTRSSDGSRGSSPRRALQLALPPPSVYSDTNNNSRDESTSQHLSPSSAAIQAALAAKSTYLTRKAHRFSSMKKAKSGGADRSQSTNFLLTRLFCSPLEVIKGEEKVTSGSSMLLTRTSSASDCDKTEKIHHHDPSRNVVKAILKRASAQPDETGYKSGKKSPSNSDESNSLRRRSQNSNFRHQNFPSPSSPSKQKLKLKSNINCSNDSSCSGFATALQMASETISLEAESHLASTLQSNFHDVLLDYCVTTTGATSGQTHASPPTYSTVAKEKNNFGDDCSRSTNGSARSNHFTFGQDFDPQGSETREANEESTEVEFKECLSDEQRSSPLPVTVEKELLGATSLSHSNANRMLPSSPSEKASDIIQSPEASAINTPLRNDGRGLKLPGKLVIPSQFLRSSTDEIFDHICSKSSSSSSSSGGSKPGPTKNKMMGQDVMMMGAKYLTNSIDATQNQYGKQSEANDLELASLFGVTRVEMARASRGFSPPPMVRLTSSLEDLATVPEASSSKETSTLESKSFNEENRTSFDHSIGDTSVQDNEKVSVIDSGHGEQTAQHFEITSENGSSARDERQYTANDLETLVKEAVQKAKREWKIEAIDKKNAGPVASQDELQKMRDRYERRVNEQKDQTALANRLAKTRLEEIERLELELKKQKDSASSDKIPSSLEINESTLSEVKTDDIEKDKESSILSDDEMKQAEKDNREVSSTVHEAEFDRLRKELGKLKFQLKSTQEESITNAKDKNRLQSELDELKEKLSLNEKEMSVRGREELNRVKRELVELKEKLVAKDKETRARTPSKENQRLQKELLAVKKELAAKEIEHSKRDSEELKRIKSELEIVKKELYEAKNGKIPKMLNSNNDSLDAQNNTHSYDELSQVKMQLEKLSKNLTNREKELEALKKENLAVGRSPSSGRRGRSMTAPTRTSRSKLPPTSGHRNDEAGDAQAEMFEREKEILRQQIALLDQQAAKTSLDHERALHELKEANEKEIEKVKKDMENRLAHHLNNDRTLKETFSQVCSREKEDLLERIERLEDEKNNDQNGGLREVQRKEELLQRIASLEKKRKETEEEHERTMQDLRMQSEAEIRLMKEDIKNLEEQRASRERELLKAISDTNSYEKKDLLDKLERMQNQLESERSGAVLLKIKFTNFEKDLAATERIHVATIQKIEQEKNLQVKSLQEQLETSPKVHEVAKELTEKDKSYKETIKKLEREKHLQLQQLKEQVAERNALEEELRMALANKLQGQSVEDLEHELKQQTRKLNQAFLENKELENLMAEAEKSHKELIYNLQQEKDRHILLLQKEIEERKALEESGQGNASELENLKKQLASEQQRRQESVDELQKEHTRAIAAMKYSSSEKLRQVQQEASAELQNWQRQIEEKCALLKQAEDKVRSLEQEAVNKDAENVGLVAQITELQDQSHGIGIHTESDQTRINMVLHEKEADFNRRLKSIELSFFHEKKQLHDEIEIQKQKRDQAEARIEEKFKKDMKVHEQKFSFEKKRLLDQIDAMKLQQKDGEKIVETRIKEMEKVMQQSLDDAEVRFSMEKQELMKQIETEKSNLAEEKNKMEIAMHDEVKKIEYNFLREKDALTEKISGLHSTMADERSTSDLLHQQEVAKVHEHMKNLELQIKTLESSMDAKVLEKMKSREQSFLEEKNALQNWIEKLITDQTENERKLKQIQEDHTRELDELLAQLDLVEAEHLGLIKDKDQIVAEKEGIISALGGQMAEMQRRTNTLEQRLTEQYDLMEQSQAITKSTEEALAACKRELQVAKDSHNEYKIEAELTRVKACEEARDEMIDRAELQFQQANEHYVKLRKQFDNAQSNILKLESRLKDTMRKLDAAKKEKDSCEINLKAEIAQRKASQANIEAEAAHMTREYRRETDRLIQTSKEYEAKVLESETTSRNIQTTLATLVAEKEKLQREYEDMKSVSEELMVIVEGQQRRDS